LRATAKGKYHHQPVVLLAQDARDRLAALGDGRRRALRQRQVLHQDGGRNQRPDLLDPEVVRGAKHDRHNLAGRLCATNQ